MADTFLKSIDSTLKTLLYTKFGDILGIDTQSSAEEDNINKGVVQIPGEIALKAVADKRGENFLEFINFWRTGLSFSWSRQRTVVSRRGLWVGEADDRATTVNVKAVPVDLNYNAWFWSKDVDKVQQCIERYLFWQQNNPKITITYNDLYDVTPDLHFGEIVDESTVPEQYEKGIIFTYKMPIKIDGWIFESSSFGEIHKIVLKVYDGDEVEDYSTIIVEDEDQNVELEAALRMFTRTLYGISSVSLATNSITVPGDRVSDFGSGDMIIIENSTSNNNVYTWVSATLSGGNTVIVVAESLVSESGILGNLYTREN